MNNDQWGGGDGGDNFLSGNIFEGASSPEDVGFRVRTLRRNYKLTQANFAKSVFISRKMLSEIENGKRFPGGQLLLAMEARFAVDRDWLLTGEGNMIICTTSGAAEAVELVTAFNRLSGVGRKKMLNLMRVFLTTEGCDI